MIATLPLAMAAPQAMAQAMPDMLVSGIEPAEQAGEAVVAITVLNRGPTPRRDVPQRIPAELAIDGRRVAVTLEREAAAETTAIPPGGFAELRYRLRLPGGEAAGGTAILSLAGSGAGYAFALPERQAHAMASAEKPAMPPAVPPAPAPAALAEAAPSAKPDEGNAFLGNLSSYAPIYAVYGPGTNSDGRVQISFKYQLFGDPGAVGIGHPFLNGVHFAYTQRMFWDLGANSSPFRNVDYMPELFYLLPAQQLDHGFALGGQLGLRHESNGRDGAVSRSLNTLYIQPVATMPLGDYTLSFGPRFWIYTGDRDDNPDIRRYRGNSGLLLEIGQADGFRLTTNSRLNFSSGKGAIDAEVSYPLDRIFESGLNLYIFGQAFTGYGENLLDYNRRTGRLRIGIGIVR